MTKQFITGFALTISAAIYSQVGINTETPKTTMDVSAKRDTSGTITDNTQLVGLQAPRLTRAELTNLTSTYGANQKGALAYITDVSGGDTVGQRINITAVGYYYFDGNYWQIINSGAASSSTEPWYNQADDTQATSNTQNIYQMGNVAVQKTDVYTDGTTSAALDVEGAVRGGTQQQGTVGANSVAFGYQNEASGLYSAAFGGNTIASGDGSVAFGRYSTASGMYSAVFGGGSASGFYSIAGGNGTIASGDYSAAFGLGTTASGNSSFAFGANNTKAIADRAVAFGWNNTSSGNQAVTFGASNTASIANAAAFGLSNTASGQNSVAFGSSNTASGNTAAVFGKGNIALDANAAVFGQYNALQTTTGTIFQIGNGTSSNHKNAVTVMTNGNTGIGIIGSEAAAVPTEMLDIGSAGVRIRNINTTSYSGNIATDKVVVADANGVLKTVPASDLTGSGSGSGTISVGQTVSVAYSVPIATATVAGWRLGSYVTANSLTALPVLDGIQIDLLGYDSTYYTPIIENTASASQLISYQTFATQVNENRTNLNQTLSPCPFGLTTFSANLWDGNNSAGWRGVDANNIVFWSTSAAEVETTNLQVQVDANTYRWYEFKWWCMEVSGFKKIFLSVTRKA